MFSVPSFRYSASRRRLLGRMLLGRKLLLASAALFCVAATWQSAHGQITVKDLVGSVVSDISQPMGKDVQEAITLFTNRKFGDARDRLKAAAKKYPQLPPAGVLMAQMFVASNQGAAARAELENTAVETPGDPEPYLVFGDLAFQQQRFTESYLCFAKAQELVKGYTGNDTRKTNLQMRSYAGLAAVASAREQYESELKLLQQWIALDPESTAAYTRLARAQYKQGDEKESYATFRKLYDEIDKERDANKKVPRPELNMALLYSQDSEKAPNAKKLMELAAERAGADDVKTHLAVAQWALQNGELEMARTSAAKAAKIDPDSPNAKLAVGMVARYEGNSDAAEQAFQAVLLKAPSNFMAINNLALTLIDQPDENKRRRALQYAQLNQRAYADGRTQEGREAAATLAWVLYKLGQVADAERAIVQVLQAGGVSNESAYHAAKILNEGGHKKEAAQILEPLLKNPSHFPGREEAEEMLAKIGSSGSSDIEP